MNNLMKVILQSVPKFLADRITTYSSRGSGISNGWLTTFPLTASLRLSDIQFQRSLRFRYNIDQADVARLWRCSCNAKMTQLHPFACRSSDVIQRHNGICSVINRAARRAGLQSVMERFQPFGGKNFKPDVVITGLSTEYVSSWVDVSICHPHLASYVHQTPEAVVRARESAKLTRYAEPAAAYNAKAYAAIVDVFGRTSKSTRDLLGASSSHAAQNRDFEQDSFAGFVNSELSIALQRGNALIFGGTLAHSKIPKTPLTLPGYSHPLNECTQLKRKKQL